METKICSSCNIEKPLDKFPTRKNRSGQIIYRNPCKECKNKRSRELRTGKQTNNIIPQTENFIEKREITQLSNDEVETLREIIKLFNDRKLMNNETPKENYIPKSETVPIIVNELTEKVENLDQQTYDNLKKALNVFQVTQEDINKLTDKTSKTSINISEENRKNLKLYLEANKANKNINQTNLINILLMKFFEISQNE